MSLLRIQIFLFMQLNRKQIMDVLHANNVEERKFSQVFTYNNIVITHQHTINVQIKPERVEELLIKNFYPKTEENKVQKVIEISLQNKIIRIIDTFTSSQPDIQRMRLPMAQKDQKNMKNPTRVQLMNKRFTKNKFQQQSMGNHQNGRDIKNVVKNIIRLFQSWLQQNHQKLHKVSLQLQKILEDSKLNNHLIIKLSKIESIRESFLIFCKKHGQEWINKSKIHDKQSHLQVLKKYQVIFYEAQDVQGQYSQNHHEKQKLPQQIYQDG